MTDRERWIVYPLLLLSIGLGVFQTGNEQQNHSADLDRVRCKALEVIGADGKAKVTLGTNENGDGVMETATANGLLAMKMGSNPSGADLTLFDGDHKKFLALGFEGQIIGLVAGLVGEQKYYLMNVLPIPRLPRPEEKTTDRSDSTDKPADSDKSPGSGADSTVPPPAQEKGPGIQ
ncbi:MAG TPA: hypothetical protein VMJ32_05940 [Pirellulales bacterium]|nr:hypothetical protein [Pirellulales bacterium]